MSRHIKVTHTYLLAVPDDAPEDDPTFDTTIMRGISIMEDFMRARSSKASNFQSSWAWLPRKRSRQLAQQSFEKQAIANTPEPVKFERVDDEEAHRVSFFGSEDSGITHPWDQGLWIFPEDHRLHEVEAAARANYERINNLGQKQYAAGMKQGFLDQAQSIMRKELNRGE